MEKNSQCGYCMEGELLNAFGIKICDLKASIVVLFKEQSHKGRVIVAYKDHVGDITQLSNEERNAFFSDLNRVADTLQTLFKPDKINYGAFGDTSGHMHFHLVPKYRDSFEWGTVFAMNPASVYLEDDGYEAIIKLIKDDLLK